MYFLPELTGNNLLKQVSDLTVVHIIITTNKITKKEEENEQGVERVKGQTEASTNVLLNWIERQLTDVISFLIQWPSHLSHQAKGKANLCKEIVSGTRILPSTAVNKVYKSAVN